MAADFKKIVLYRCLSIGLAVFLTYGGAQPLDHPILQGLAFEASQDDDGARFVETSGYAPSITDDRLDNLLWMKQRYHPDTSSHFCQAYRHSPRSPQAPPFLF